jgi:D-hydroxyproline dehydrogenase subunit beta
LPSFDLAVVGGGIVGLAHALAATRRNLRVIVLDRDARANGASIRNFGFITVTGQSEGTVWRRALRSRDIWIELATKANIPIVHRNECVIVHSEAALDVLEAFAATEMGAQCRLLTSQELVERVPMARGNAIAGGLWSPLDLRIEPRTAIPALADYLAAQGVTLRYGVQVYAVATPAIQTSAGTISAERVIVAPGPDLTTLYPQTFARNGVRQCKLHMLRLAPQPPQWRLPAAIMSDFALTRYPGFSAQPGAAALATTLAAQYPQIFAYGIHLIVVQSADGSLIVGDSHEYGTTMDPFFSSDVEATMLGLAHDVMQIPNADVIERWIGIYPQSPAREWFADAPDARTRVVAVTTGNGMSTSFGLAEEVIADLCG